MLLRPFRFDFFRQDISAGFVVFLVALPLCLGIAIASEAPPLAGLISGIVAGLLVSFLSGSELSVSGPAAGLTVTVIAATKSIGSFEGLLVATILAGCLQLILGAARAGLLATFFPSSVIKGMLAGIGIIIAFKQIPHAVGWKSPFNTEDGMFCLFSPFCLKSLFSQIKASEGSFDMAAIIISVSSIALLLKWDKLAALKGGIFKALPAPLLVVLMGILLNGFFTAALPGMALTPTEGQLVKIPHLTGLADLFSHGPGNVMTWLGSSKVWVSAVVIALIASVETLLSVEATDKLDPLKRVSRPNRELVAQGIGNIASGAMGGIPMTAVIVRSSTNVYAGGVTRLSALTHGIFLLLSTIVFPTFLNQIPLASLSAILILVGYKLANKKMVKSVWDSGIDQFLPFAITAAGVVIFDLLTGVFVGTCVGLLVVLIMNHHEAFSLVNEGRYYLLRFAKDVTFLQKIALKSTLARLPNDSDLIIDCGGAMFVDHDIMELIEDFKASSVDRNIRLELTNFPKSKFDLLSAFSRRKHHG